MARPFAHAAPSWAAPLPALFEEQPIAVKVTAYGRTFSTKVAPRGWTLLWLPATKGICP